MKKRSTNYCSRSTAVAVAAAVGFGMVGLAQADEKVGKESFSPVAEQATVNKPEIRPQGSMGLGAPANDQCSGAITVACGQTVFGSTFAATFDDAGTCGTTNTAPGVWYRVVGTGDTIEVNTCDANSSYDTKLTVFTGSCGNLECVGGNDDSPCQFGGLLSRVVFPSNDGQEYFVLVHGFSAATGDFGLNVICLDPPDGNDACDGAIAIECGGSVTGSTVGASGPDVGTCGTSATSPGVWYSIVSDEDAVIVADTCSPNSNYDTKLSVFTDGCGTLTCITGNDDAACEFGGLLSRVEWLANAGQEYLIYVHGFSSAVGDFELSVSCSEPPPPYECPAGSLDEGEPCGSDFNGGCNMASPAFTDINCGETYCGSAWATGGTRDTDWYRIVLDEAAELTWCGTAEFPLLIGIVNNFGVDSCAGVSAFLTFDTASPLNEACVSANLAAGTWYLFVATQAFEGTPCGTGNGYTATVTVDGCSPPSCVGDLNNDGVVNVSDLLILLGAWGACPGCDADLNDDGVVNVSDMLVLLGAWGNCPTPPTPTGACCIADGSCEDDLTSAECSAAGGTYQGSNSLCADINCPQPLENDFCDDAIDITANINGAAVTGDNTGANALGVPSGSPSCHWQGVPENINNVVWYEFVAPGSSVSITSCASQGTLVDTVIAVYSGDCDNLVEIACGEDECGGPTWFSTLTASGLTPGNTYKMMLANPGFGNPGTFSFTITTP